MLRMQQGGKPLCDDQMQAAGQGALDQWTRSCGGNEPGCAPAVRTGPKRTPDSPLSQIGIR